jgi:hypothetical protein
MRVCSARAFQVPHLRHLHERDEFMQKQKKIMTVEEPLARTGWRAAGNCATVLVSPQ